MDLMYLPADAISAWIPFTTSPFFVEDYYGNWLLYPAALPITPEFKLLEQAILRARIRAMVSQALEKPNPGKPLELAPYCSVNEKGIFVLPELLQRTTDAREAVLIALDGLEPSTTFVFRKLDGDESLLCPAICFEGQDSVKAAVSQTLVFQFENGEKTPVAITPDEIVWVNAVPGTEAVVEYELTKATINGKAKGSLSITFGELGVVIDSRGRPFPIPQDTLVDKSRVRKWFTGRQQLLTPKEAARD